MDVTDAYMAEVIAGEEVVLDVDETEELKTWIGELADEHIKQLQGYDATSATADDVKEIWTELCLHSFMAGRAYQTQFDQENDDDLFTRKDVRAILRYWVGDEK